MRFFIQRMQPVKAKCFKSYKKSNPFVLKRKVCQISIYVVIYRLLNSRPIFKDFKIFNKCKKLFQNKNYVEQVKTMCAEIKKATLAGGTKDNKSASDLNFFKILTQAENEVFYV